MKIKALLLVAALGSFIHSPLNAGSRGFGGALAGGALGSIVGSAMTRPRSRTTVVQAAPTTSSADVIILNEKVKQLAYENTRLERKNTDLEEKVEEQEKIIERLRKKVKRS